MRTVISTLCAAGALLATVAAAPAAILTRTYSYFAISGSTVDGILNELRKRGPHVETTGMRHAGATRMEFTKRFSYQQTGSTCRIAAASVSVKADVILPRWSDPKAGADVRFFWSTLASDIKRHEESHVSIAKRYARTLEERVLAIGRQSNCEIAAEKADAVSKKVLDQHDQAQQLFDRIETKNFDQRLMNLLQYRLEQATNSSKTAPAR